MKLIRLLILEDDLLTLSTLLQHLYLLEERLVKFDAKKSLAITILSEYTQVKEYVNKNPAVFDIILLDRDCKSGGSFHCIDFKKHQVNKVIGISSVPAYNEQLREKGIKRIVHKDFAHIDIFAKNVIQHLEELISQL